MPVSNASSPATLSVHYVSLLVDARFAAPGSGSATRHRHVLTRVGIPIRLSTRAALRRGVSHEQRVYSRPCWGAVSGWRGQARTVGVLTAA